MDGTLYGYVIAVETKEGYGGNIRLYMGMTLDGTVKGISILEIHETPGLGMRASEVLVPQFRDVSAPEFTVTKKGAKSDSEIDAITSATITSKAVTRGVNFGMKLLVAILILVVLISFLISLTIFLNSCSNFSSIILFSFLK